MVFSGVSGSGFLIYEPPLFCGGIKCNVQGGTYIQRAILIILVPFDVKPVTLKWYVYDLAVDGGYLTKVIRKAGVLSITTHLLL